MSAVEIQNRPLSHCIMISSKRFEPHVCLGGYRYTHTQVFLCVVVALFCVSAYACSVCVTPK